METSEIIYEVDGQPIHAITAGKPNRQIALLIHGWSSSSYALSPLTGLLSQRFSCIAIDLPGYGKSPRLPERTSIEGYADLLINLLGAISDRPVVLVGHSMGGMISLTMALKEPALIERMVLLNPTITGVLSTFVNVAVSPVTMLDRFRLTSSLVSVVERSFVGITDRIMRPASFAERTDITEQDYYRLRADARRPGQGKVRAECYRAMRENNLTGKVGKIEKPSLVIWGAEDNTVPLRDAGVIADEWPLADLRILPKSGHWPHFEAPDTTRRLVASFLGLPLTSDALYTPVEDEELARIQEAAQFLSNSDIGRGMNLAQRTRLAGQLRQRILEPYKPLVTEDEEGSEMYIIQAGTVEVWQDPENPGVTPKQPHRVATIKPGQMTGELSMLDQGLRTADLITGAEGATILALSRERLLAISEDDAELGTVLLWNIATSMSQRVRFILWQLQRASQRAEAILQRGQPRTGRVKTQPIVYPTIQQ
ncbi:MAG: alpha/beta fold hydrolase [Anaerolineales bacterium]|nr:alpha/beta fold hydrolase [Anaerolineales bacterium]